MKNECKIVRDLLPLYAENMVSEETAEFVKEHLANCPACAEELAALQKDDLKEATPENISTAAPLKTLKKKLRRRTMGTISKTTVIVVTIAAIVACLLAWRFWPHSFSAVLSDTDAFASLSASASEGGNETVGSISMPYIDFYTINSAQASGKMIDELLEILKSTSYTQDFRNLLPWGIDSVENDKSYDGRVVVLSFRTRDNKSVSITALCPNVLTINDGDGTKVFHPTDSKMFDRLFSYIQENGVKE